jgi:hypothetical protein
MGLDAVDVDVVAERLRVVAPDGRDDLDALGPLGRAGGETAAAGTVSSACASASCSTARIPRRSA